MTCTRFAYPMLPPHSTGATWPDTLSTRTPRLSRACVLASTLLALPALQVELVFDPEPILRFTPHLADDASEGDIEGADANGRWGPWREQV